MFRSLHGTSPLKPIVFVDVELDSVVTVKMLAMILLHIEHINWEIILLLIIKQCL